MHCFHPGSSTTIVAEKFSARFYLLQNGTKVILYALPAGFVWLAYESIYPIKSEGTACQTCCRLHCSTPQYTPVHPNKQNNCAVTELIALVIVWAHQASCQRWQEDVIHPIVHVQNSATRNMIFLVTMYVACMFTLPPLIPPTVLYKKITRSSSTSVVTMNNICTPIFWMKLWILPPLHPPLAQ